MSRIAALQQLCAGPTDCFLFVGGPDGPGTPWHTSLLSSVLALPPDHDADDLVLVVHRAGARLYVPPAHSARFLARFSTLSLLEIHALPAAALSDADAVEDHKMIAFRRIVRGFSRVGVPADPDGVERWPLVQSYALQEYGENLGFFTMSHTVHDATAQIAAALHRVDGARLAHLVSDRAPHFLRAWSEILPPAPDLTEEDLSESLQAYYEHAHLRDASDELAELPPRLLLGSRSALLVDDSARCSGSASLATMPQARHYVVEATGLDGLRCCRTHFIGNGFAPQAVDDRVQAPAVATPSDERTPDPSDTLILVAAYEHLSAALAAAIDGSRSATRALTAQDFLDAAVARLSAQAAPHLSCTLQGVEGEIQYARLALMVGADGRHGAVAVGDSFLVHRVPTLGRCEAAVLTASFPLLAQWPLPESAETKAVRVARESLRAAHAVPAPLLGTPLLGPEDGVRAVFAESILAPHGLDMEVSFFERALVLDDPRTGPVLLPVGTAITRAGLYSPDSLDASVMLVVWYRPEARPFRPLPIAGGSSDASVLGIVIPAQSHLRRQFLRQVLPIWRRSFAMDAGAEWGPVETVPPALDQAFRGRPAIAPAMASLLDVSDAFLGDVPRALDEVLFPHDAAAGQPDRQGTPVTIFSSGGLASGALVAADALMHLRQGSCKFFAVVPDCDTEGGRLVAKFARLKSAASASKTEREPRIVLIAPAAVHIANLVRALEDTAAFGPTGSFYISHVVACVNPAALYPPGRPELDTEPNTWHHCVPGWAQTIAIAPGESACDVRPILAACNPGARIVTQGDYAPDDVSWILDQHRYQTPANRRARHLSHVRRMVPQGPLFAAKAVPTPASGPIIGIDAAPGAGQVGGLVPGDLAVVLPGACLVPLRSEALQGTKAALFAQNADMVRCREAEPAKEAAPAQARTRASLTDEELDEIADKHLLDPLPDGFFFNGTRFVDFDGKSYARHPHFDQFVDAWLAEHGS